MMKRSRIVGTGRGVPPKVVTNADLEKLVDTTHAWIVERTGIEARRELAPELSTSDLAAEAGRSALEMAGVPASEVDCIIVGTVTPDMPMPSTAVFVQQKLGAGNCAAFDLSAACAGFVYGMSIADAFCRAGQFRKVLVIGVEILTRIVDWQDRNTCVLFGDGAGAALIVAEDVPHGGEGARGILSTHIFADGAGAPHLWIPGGGSRRPTDAQSVAENLHKVKMNGKQVFQHAVRNISAAMQTALDHNGMGADDVDLVVAHQANLRIVEAVAQRVGLPLDKFHLNIQRYGNTSSASIPIALDEALREGKVKDGMNLLMGALGAGFAWGSAMVRW
jgi:3-oxoacyl-[acyl-carrier-protein] synthase-3